MKIAVVAFDTRGGIQPYVALSLGLQRAGHDVRMITTAGFADLVTSHGVPLAATTGDAEAAVRQAGAADMSRRERDRFMRSHLHSTIRQTAGEVLDAAHDADLLIGGIGGSLTGVPVAEKLGVPFVEAHLQPLGPPTAAFPGPLLPEVPDWLGGPGRKASHRLTAIALRSMFGPAQRQVRAALDLSGRRTRPRADQPVLYGISPQVVPQPPEWRPHRTVTGYWMLPARSGWQPPQVLADFLGAGPPPVCIGFGSMSGRDPQALTDLVVAAVRRAGVRAVLLSGWGGLLDQPVDDVVVVSEAPHDWLYPQMAAVVHHGGAGTTAAGLSAGVPAIVIPFAVDQPFWGSRVAALGVGPPPLPRAELTVENLGDALRRTVDDRGMEQRARALGGRIRAEDGVGEAVRVISSHWT